MALNPAATNASSSVNAVASSMVQPITFPPNTNGEISRSEPPSLRFFISILSRFVAAPFPHTLWMNPRERMVHQEWEGHRLSLLPAPALPFATIMRRHSLDLPGPSRIFEIHGRKPVRRRFRRSRRVPQAKRHGAELPRRKHPAGFRCNRRAWPRLSTFSILRKPLTARSATAIGRTW